MGSPPPAVPSPPPGTRSLLQHAVLVGLTPLIPLPLVDDLARVALRRRLVRAVAEDAGVPLGDAEVEALASEPPSGCLSGCLLVVIYPVKKIFRKIFYFLEIKRAMDLVSTSWHFGWLLDVALREGRVAPGDTAAAARVRAAIDQVVDEASVRPVERAFREAFDASRGGLSKAADLLGAAVRGKGRDPDRLEQAAAQVEPQQEAQIEDLVQRLQRLLASVPAEHFVQLRAALDRRLDEAAAAPVPPAEGDA